MVIGVLSSQRRGVLPTCCGVPVNTDQSRSRGVGPQASGRVKEPGCRGWKRPPVATTLKFAVTTAGGAVNVSVTLWVLTIVGLAALIAVDFFIGRKPHDVSIKEAGIWTVVWIALAGLFGVGLLVFSGGEPAGEFFAGFITEKSLSVDNLFVFVLIMAKFAVPSQYQQRVLLVGVLIALVLRAIFIAAGAAILASFAWVFYIFGAFLIWTAWKLIQEARADDEDEEFEENKLLKAAEKRFGVADRYHGTKLWIEENGKRIMTPMLVVMLAIGTTDVLFALDSIPAIFGLTQDPYIVFTANAFALMGLRQLYFLIGGLLRKLVHLSYGLSVILGFIGIKLVLHALHESGVHVPEISIPVSLGVICGVLVITTITSLMASRKQEALKAAQHDSEGAPKDSIEA
ncbi:membrane protein, TerC family [Streptomyces turgidiscabies Car8]|uniref:Membrane protein, TerC family n=1 Tax=Streptomyces turgidiscabies (strain Car8) TaxID=698760 RepID=L7ESM6_STRT8|nr:membrane protein, TerC family [Streptomyces turgidiscabies Car8]